MKTFFIAFLIASSAYAQKIKVDLSVTAKGFEPNKVDVPAHQPVTLKITRKTDDTCANEIQIPSLKLKKKLPLNKTVSINLGRLEKGNMMESGIIYVK